MSLLMQAQTGGYGQWDLDVEKDQYTFSTCYVEMFRNFVGTKKHLFYSWKAFIKGCRYNGVRVTGEIFLTLYHPRLRPDKMHLSLDWATPLQPPLTTEQPKKRKFMNISKPRPGPGRPKKRPQSQLSKTNEPPPVKAKQRQQPVDENKLAEELFKMPLLDLGQPVLNEGDLDIFYISETLEDDDEFIRLIEALDNDFLCKLKIDI